MNSQSAGPLKNKLKLKFNKKLVLAIILLICGTCFLFHRDEKYIISSNAGSNAYVAEAYTGRITASNSLEIPQGSVPGCAYITPLPYLDKGEYEVIVKYSSDSDTGCIDIYSDQAANERNQPEKIFLKENLPSTQGETATVKIDWSPDQNIYTSTIRFFYEEGNFTLHNITLQSQGAAFHDNLFLGIAITLCGLFLLISFLRKPDQDCSVTVILLGFTAILASLPSFSQTVVNGHDLPFHLARIAGMHQGIYTGEVPLYVNTVQLSGFGYLSGAMYPQLFLYIPALLRLLGVSMMTSYNIFIFLINGATVIVAWKSFSALCRSSRIGAVAAILFTMAPYRLLDMYTRSALGELLALIFVPLVIYGTYEVLWGDHKKWPFLVMGMTGILQSHLISVELAAIVIGLEGLIWLITLRKGKRYLQGIWGMVKAVSVTVLINLFFLIPFLYYSRTPMEALTMKIPMHQHSIYFSQMLTPKVWAGGSSLVLGLEDMFKDTVPETAPGQADVLQGEMSFALGIIFTVGFLAMAMWIAWKKIRKEKLDVIDYIGLHCIAIAGVTCFMASNLFPWDVIQSSYTLNKLLSPLQFIWRFLGFTSALLSVAAAIAFVRWGRKLLKERLCLATAALLVLLTTWQFYNSIPKQTVEIPAESRMMINGIDTTDTLYLYAPVSEDEFNRKQGIIKVSGSSAVDFSGYEKKGSTVRAHIAVSEYDSESCLIFPLYYYPGYEVSWNGKVLPEDQIFPVNGKAAVRLPDENGLVEIRYRGHWSFPWSIAVSAVSFAGLVIMQTAGMRKRKREADDK